MRGPKLVLLVLVSVSCLAVAVTGCGATQPEVTFITPANGARVQVGQNVAVRITATDNRGLVGIQLWVDGELYQTDRDAQGQKSYTVAISWRPAAPGEHILAARSVDTKGNSSEPVRVTVTAVGAGGAPPAGGGAPPAGGGQPPAGGGAPPAGGGQPPAGGGAPPAGGGGLPVIDYFTSEPSERAGCYYLHWDLHDATAAFINGQGVTAPGSTEVCPTETTVYRLEATNDAGTTTQEVVIEVGAAAPSGQPDLVINELAIQPESPRRGDVATVRVTVYNQGNAASPPFSVQWWATPALVGCSWEMDNGLVAHGGRVLECQYTYASWSTYTTHAIVDDDNSIAESDEGNNTRELVVRVQQGGP